MCPIVLISVSPPSERQLGRRDGGARPPARDPALRAPGTIVYASRVLGVPSGTRSSIRGLCEVRAALGALAAGGAVGLPRADARSVSIVTIESLGNCAVRASKVFDPTVCDGPGASRQNTFLLKSTVCEIDPPVCTFSRVLRAVVPLRNVATALPGACRWCRAPPRAMRWWWPCHRFAEAELMAAFRAFASSAIGVCAAFVSLPALPVCCIFDGVTTCAPCFSRGDDPLSAPFRKCTKTAVVEVLVTSRHLLRYLFESLSSSPPATSAVQGACPTIAPYASHSATRLAREP